MLMCMESVYVVGGCNVVAHEGMFCFHGYEVSFLPTECSIRKKTDVLTAILQSSSEHTQHAQNTAVYAQMKTAEVAVKTSAFF